MFENVAQGAEMGLAGLLELLCAAVSADGVIVTVAGRASESVILASAPSGLAGRTLPLSTALLAVCDQGVQPTAHILLPSVTTGWLGSRPSFVSAAKIDWDNGEGLLFCWWKSLPNEAASQMMSQASHLVGRFAAQQSMATTLRQMQDRLDAMMENVSLGLVFVDSIRGSALNPVASEILDLPASTSDTAKVVAAMQQIKSQCVVESPEALPLDLTHLSSASTEYWICSDRDLALRVESHAVGSAQAPGRFWVFTDVRPLWKSSQKLRTANLSLESNLAQLAGEVERRIEAEATLREYSMKLKQQNEELEIARLESELLANQDVLTGLLNRRRFVHRLNIMLGEAIPSNRKVVLFYLDMDKFKEINDSFGHERGDQLLHQVAETLISTLRKDDLIARFGGDEFSCAMSMPMETPMDAVTNLASRLSQQLKISIGNGAEIIHVSATIGIAIYPYDAEDAASLLRAADNAMYLGKRKGGNEVTITARSNG